MYIYQRVLQQSTQLLAFQCLQQVCSTTTSAFRVRGLRSNLAPWQYQRTAAAAAAATTTTTPPTTACHPHSRCKKKQCLIAVYCIIIGIIRIVFV